MLFCYYYGSGRSRFLRGPAVTNARPPPGHVTRRPGIRVRASSKMPLQNVTSDDGILNCSDVDLANRKPTKAPCNSRRGIVRNLMVRFSPLKCKNYTLTATVLKYGTAPNTLSKASVYMEIASQWNRSQVCIHITYLIVIF